MHDGLDPVLAVITCGQAVGVGDVADDQTGGRVGDGRDVSLEQVVVGDRVMAVAEQPARQALPM